MGVGSKQNGAYLAKIEITENVCGKDINSLY